MSERYLQIDAVRRVFLTKKGPFCALEEISLDIHAGEFVSLIGHSGCGKSTLLNIVAGLLKPTRGHIVLAEREVTGPGPDRGVVFQNHSLLPWLTCFENVHLAVERVFGATAKKAVLRERVHRALELVQLGHAEHKYPHEISGGMKQRVGIARALSIEPKVLLLDEPLFLSDRVVMMTNGPAATIGGVLTIDLPRPRERIALAGHRRYMALRAELLEFLYRKQMREAA